MNEKKIKLAAVTGPTASGKSALAVELAELLGGEVVSCDSMQIYRGMDIGTAKPSLADMHGIPHHMIDIADPYSDSDYSCARFVTEASAVISEINARGKLPIVCGGTGMYLDSLLRGIRFGDAPADSAVREELLHVDPDRLYDELREVDPESAAAIHRNNVKRVARALEIYRVSGITKTEWDSRSRTAESPYDYCTLALGELEREILYERIDRRVDDMFAYGLCEEVKRLKLIPGSTASEAIGYKETELYLRGKISRGEASDMIKEATRRYAKRQITWLRHREGINWIISCDGRERGDARMKNIVNISLTLLRRAGIVL